VHGHEPVSPGTAGFQAWEQWGNVFSML
jgi:hypothetical protein